MYSEEGDLYLTSSYPRLSPRSWTEQSLDKPRSSRGREWYGDHIQEKWPEEQGAQPRDEHCKNRPGHCPQVSAGLLQDRTTRWGCEPRGRGWDLGESPGQMPAQHVKEWELLWMVMSTLPWEVASEGVAEVGLDVLSSQPISLSNNNLQSTGGKY